MSDKLYTQAELDAQIQAATAALIEKAIEIVEISPTWNKHKRDGSLCACELCTYVRGNATELRTLSPGRAALDKLLAQARMDAVREFSRVNRERCESPTGFNHKLDSWSTSDWFTATLGELGEAANIAKKLNRVRDGLPGNKETMEELQAKLRHEIGDVYVYLDLLAQSLGFYIIDAAIEVFNQKSQQIGCKIIIAEPESQLAALKERTHGV